MSIMSQYKQKQLISILPSLRFEQNLEIIGQQPDLILQCFLSSSSFSLVLAGDSCVGSGKTMAAAVASLLPLRVCPAGLMSGGSEAPPLPRPHKPEVLEFSH